MKKTSIVLVTIITILLSTLSISARVPVTYCPQCGGAMKITTTLGDPIYERRPCAHHSKGDDIYAIRQKFYVYSCLNTRCGYQKIDNNYDTVTKFDHCEGYD